MTSLLVLIVTLVAGQAFAVEEVPYESPQARIQPPVGRAAPESSPTLMAWFVLWFNTLIT